MRVLDSSATRIFFKKKKKKDDVTLGPEENGRVTIGAS